MADDLPTFSYDPTTHDLELTAKRSKEDADLDRHIRRLTTYGAMVVLAIAGFGAAYLAFAAAENIVGAATKEWSRNVLTALIGGVVGYIFAKK